jgi:glycosyltransferase involved in cell wall biosynthesis
VTAKTIEVESGVPVAAPGSAHEGWLDLPTGRSGPVLVVLIPALNEQEMIGRVVSEIPRKIPGVARVEVIVVDDGSEDLTADRAWAAGVDHVARHPGNRGLAAAFSRGATEALARHADVVVTLDADGQHDASLMPRLVAPIVAGDADLVVAARPLDDATQGSPLRRSGNRFGSWMARRVLRVPLSDVTSGYRAFSREALMHMHVTSSYTYTLDTLIQAANKRLRVVEIVAPARPRTVGTSRMTHSLVRYIARTGNQAFRTTLHANPLRAFGRLSSVFALMAAAVTAWFLISYAGGGLHLPALLAAMLLAIGAAALLICGLMADGISSNRRLLEDALHRIKRMEARGGPALAAGLPAGADAPALAAGRHAPVLAAGLPAGGDAPALAAGLPAGPYPLSRVAAVRAAAARVDSAHGGERPVESVL